MISKDVLPQLLKDQSQRLSGVILQIINIAVMDKDKVFILLSDSFNQIDGNLDPAMIEMVQSGKLKENQLILVKEYTIVNNEGRYKLNILNFDPLEIIPKQGDPKPMNKFMQHMAESYTPITALSTFLYDWTLRAKVTNKSALMDYVNAKQNKSEKYMTAKLTDANGSVISASFFSDAANKFFGFLEEGKVYLFSNGNVSLADKKYRTQDTNYKLQFGANADITLDIDQNFEMRRIERELVGLDRLREFDNRTIVDVIGFVIDVGKSTEKTSKLKGEKLIQRIIKIADSSNMSVELSLWNELATDPRIDGLIVNESVIHAKSVSVTFYNETLYLSSAKGLTEISINPVSQPAQLLSQWMRGGSSQGIIDLTIRKEVSREEEIYNTIEQVKAKQPGNDKYFTICRVQMTKNLEKISTYPSCNKCKKKVDSSESGVYNCLACGSFSRECIHKFLVRGVMLGDPTGSIYVTMFNESAEFLFNLKAADYVKLSDEEKTNLLQNVSTKQFVFSLRVALVNRQDMARNEYTVAGVYPVNFGECTKRIMRMIGKLALNK